MAKDNKKNAEKGAVEEAAPSPPTWLTNEEAQPFLNAGVGTALEIAGEGENRKYLYRESLGELKRLVNGGK